MLRSIGMTKTRIKLLYFYEALLLVLASSILGVLIGCLISVTINLELLKIFKNGLPLLPVPVGIVRLHISFVAYLRFYQHMGASLHHGQQADSRYLQK